MQIGRLYSYKNKSVTRITLVLSDTKAEVLYSENSVYSRGDTISICFDWELQNELLSIKNYMELCGCL